MLDSGAYSAWKQGKAIDLEKYIAYIKRNGAAIDTYVNLDVIPGRPGTPPTEGEVEASAQKSYENLKTMRAAGLTPLPVFHQHEKFDWLEKMLDDGHTFIGISPAEGPHLPRRRWLDRVFMRLRDENGGPLVRTHGFGVGSVELITRYPWRSVDSASWFMRSKYGRIWLPQYEDGAPQYLLNPKTVMVARPKRWGPLPTDHYENLWEIEKHYLRRFLAKEVGTTIEAVAVTNAIAERARANAVYYTRLGEHLRSTSGRWFDPHRPDDRWLIVFASTAVKFQHEVLTDLRIQERLLSYCYLLDQPDDLLSRLMTTGLIGERDKRRRKWWLDGLPVVEDQPTEEPTV